MRRLLVCSAACFLVLIPFVPSGSGHPAVSSLYLGITGDPGRFQGQTGQRSTVRQAFISWDQGRTFGKKIPVLLASLRPIPMVHVGTAGRAARTRQSHRSRSRRERVTRSSSR